MIYVFNFNLISENIDNNPWYALPVGRPGLEELQDFVILQVVMFYPDEEQQNLIQDVFDFQEYW